MPTSLPKIQMLFEQKASTETLPNNHHLLQELILLKNLLYLTAQDMLVILQVLVAVLLHVCYTENIFKWANETYLYSEGTVRLCLKQSSSKTINKSWIIHLLSLATQTLL